jgi:hypothetical protein
MQILVSILYRRTGESWKSIQCEAADRGICIVWQLSRQKIPCAFSQELVTSGGNEMQEKDELYRRALWSEATLSIRRRMPPNRPDYPFRASSLGERLIEKASRSRAIPRAYVPFAPRSTSIRRIAAEITASMAASTPHGSASRASPRAPTVEISSNLRFAGFPSDYATAPTVAFVIPN